MGVGSGDLEKNKKYVVLLEFYGPAPLRATLKLRDSLTKLLRRYKGRIKENVSADKRKPFDPRRGWVKHYNPPDSSTLVPAPAKKARTRRKAR
jgi:hypothetical protein